MVVGGLFLLGVIIFQMYVMHSQDSSLPILFFVTLMGFFLFGLTIWSLDIFDTAYREGQIDALTGKVKYELKTNSDSTKTWEYKIK